MTGIAESHTALYDYAEQDLKPTDQCLHCMQAGTYCVDTHSLWSFVRTAAPRQDHVNMENENHDFTIRATGNPALFYLSTDKTMHRLDLGSRPEDVRERSILNALLDFARETA